MSELNLEDGIVEGISSQFAKGAGDGEGFSSPDYDPQTVAIVVQETAKGYLVHENVGLIGLAMGEGTGEYSTDAIKYYSNEDFVDKFDDGDFITLDDYTRDMKGMEAGSVANDKFLLVSDLDMMKDRVQEVDRDVTAYQNNLNEQINELQLQAGVPNLGCN